MGHGGDIYRNRVELDFSVNLNPLGTPAEVSGAIRAALERVDVYPDPEQEAVRRAIAECEGVPADCVIAGNGASELLLAAVRALRPVRAILPEPAFTGYAHALEAACCPVKRVILDASDGFRLKASMLDELFPGASEGELLILCDPSNPAGVSLEEDVLEEILKRAKRQGVSLLLDESFLLLSDKAETLSPCRSARLLEEYEHLIIVRSVTKLFSVPGIRAGYALSSAQNVRRMRAQLPEWNLSVPAEAALTAGCRVLAETDFAQSSRELICRERKFLSEKLRESGLEVFASEAPFLLIRGPEDLYRALLSRGILIRDCSDYPGLGSGWFRIAVRDHASNERFTGMLGDLREQERPERNSRGDVIRQL
ncbi:MAG: aminotransferase class I/II-fold pyridoxal phosphate-dependent enzyme [Lachnospiraceae bacterium]|nr:aminotransferase class I/II-fold pyridoxal phosphate-dependent enzyme [Lachnospiraceae bacterium]